MVGWRDGGVAQDVINRRNWDIGICIGIGA